MQSTFVLLNFNYSDRNFPFCLTIPPSLTHPLLVGSPHAEELFVAHSFTVSEAPQKLDRYPRCYVVDHQISINRHGTINHGFTYFRHRATRSYAIREGAARSGV